MRSIGPAVTREQSPAFLRNSNGRLDFPGPTQEASRIPRRNSRIPLQLEKIHVVPPSSQDEALSRYSAPSDLAPEDRAPHRASTRPGQARPHDSGAREPAAQARFASSGDREEDPRVAAARASRRLTAPSWR